MKTQLKVILVTAWVASGAAVTHGQAMRDPKLTGTYIAAVTGHTVPGGGFGGIRIGGVLFSFAMNYSAALGYHTANAASGILFLQGKKYPITFDAAVPPFTSALQDAGLSSGKGGPKNRDLDFLMRANISLFNVRTWWFYGTLPFRREKGDYFTRSRTSYKADQDYFGSGGLGADVGEDPYIEFDDGTLLGTDDDYNVEAVRVSTIVGVPAARATRIKIDR